MAAVATHDFPVELLEGCETALVVFAAAFGGQQDAAYIRDAGLRAVCVDHDAVALRDMSHDYPANWFWINCDAFDLPRWVQARGFDVVTLDPWSGVLMDRVHAELGLFADMADKALIVGSGVMQPVEPDGWRIASHMLRSPRNQIYWTSMVRC